MKPQLTTNLRPITAVLSIFEIGSGQILKIDTLTSILLPWMDRHYEVQMVYDNH